MSIKHYAQVVVELPRSFPTEEAAQKAAEELEEFVKDKYKTARTEISIWGVNDERRPLR